MYNNPLFIHLLHAVTMSICCKNSIHTYNCCSYYCTVFVYWYLPPYYCGLNNIVHISTVFMRILLSADQLIVKSRYIMYQSNLSIIFIFPCNHYGSMHSLILLRRSTYIHNTQDNTTCNGEKLTLFCRLSVLLCL